MSDNAPQHDDPRWREQITRRAWYNPAISFEHYESALALGRSSREKLTNATFEQVVDELALQWAKGHGGTTPPWDQVRAAVEDAWNRGDEFSADAIALEGGFKSPPTFLEHGRSTPRNLDEPNN